MKKFRKANIKRIISAAVVSALIASGVGYTFVSSAANTITLASSGRFEYDADGNGTINGAAGDIILDSDDLVALKDAVTGLNSSLTAISTKAYGADGVPNYTGQLKDASGNLISGDPDDLESKYYSYQTSHSYTNTQYETVSSAAQAYTSSVANTSMGKVAVNCLQVLTGYEIYQYFPTSITGGSGTSGSNYAIWAGKYTAAEIAAKTWTPTQISVYNYVPNEAQSYGEVSNSEVWTKQRGFLGKLTKGTMTLSGNYVGVVGESFSLNDPVRVKISGENRSIDLIRYAYFTIAPFTTQ